MPFGVPWRRRTSDRPGGPMMPMPRATWLAAVVVASLHSAESAFSEEPALVRPFLFSVSTAPSATSRWAVFTESAIGGGTSAPSAYDGLEQYLGVQGSLGHGLTLLGQFGMRDSGITAAQGVQQGELLKDLCRGNSSGCVAVGLGARREWDRTTTFLGRISVRQSIGRSMLVGNVRFERALTTGRDGIDVITSLGWAQRVTRALNIGAEVMGEDLEGFWENDEAEGGARLFVGPALHVAPPGSKLQLSLVGGPMIHATRNNYSSSAPRALAGSKGYAARASLAYSF